jgi:hypothetical protein
VAHDYVDSGDAVYISFDPGLTTGYAVFRDDGSLIRSGSVYAKENYQLYEFLQEVNAFQLKVIIIEDYRLFPWKSKAQSWDRLDTVRYIGAIQYWAYLHGVPTVEQAPNIKGIAYRWAGISPPKNHAMSHEPDAFVHGVYYLQSNGIRSPQQGRAK